MEFTKTARFKAQPKDIYKAWLSSNGHSKMTGGEAKTSDKVGGKFTAWDGYIEGENLHLEPYSIIIQSWRTSQFKEDEEDSRIEITLRDVDGETEFTLLHSNVPESGEHYIQGWEEHYLRPMAEYFSNL